MDVLGLARLQFASTTIFHYFFVPVSIGLALIIAIMQTLYVVKDKYIYKRMTKFWGKLFLINFAVGVVTGILQEFQFGMNWSTYSRFVGDVFGPSLAIEGLLAFFFFCINLYWHLVVCLEHTFKTSSFIIHLARITWNDFISFLDSFSKLIYAKSCWL